MKRLMITALIAGQLTTTVQPAAAAEIGDESRQRMGAFGGLRVRVPLDGHVQQRAVRAGLTLAPTMHSRTSEGATRLRIGEGLELGIAGRQPVRLMVAGQDVRRLGAAQNDESEEEDRGGGPSTIGWIAIGVGALAIGLVAAVAICAEDHDCIPSE